MLFRSVSQSRYLPAGGLESRPEIAAQTPFARLPVIQEKAVGAAQPVVMEIVDDGDPQRKSGLVHGRGQSRQDIVDLPDIEMAQLLISPEPAGDRLVVPSPERGEKGKGFSGSQKFFRGADVIFHLVVLLERVPDPKNRPLLAAVFQIAAEDLKDFQAAHAIIFESLQRWKK